jgi:type IV pilus assembly protein PilX
MTCELNMVNKKLSLQKLNRQDGVSLILVMMVLAIVSLLGVAGIQIATMGERSARNDRDMQVAWQAAEAALVDAEFDIFGPTASVRRSIFEQSNNISNFVTGCSNTGNNVGLCLPSTVGRPVWLTVDFTNTTNSARTTAFGTYTARTFSAGGLGTQPAQLPRYIIEAIPDTEQSDLTAKPPKYIYMYRVTAMGFGPRSNIQAVLQMIYRY